ncbi:MAG TPA: HIT family protein [Candidatus Dormibacteraeota bacterium]|nr:HIT family protein [Candidatus Dormibacteraeota bacterium]
MTAGPTEEPFGPGTPSLPGAGCAFCHPEASPGVLTANEHVRLLPDLYPVAPGHVLVVSQEHLSCYGAAPAEVLTALETLSQTAAQFVRDAYGVEPVLWENGGAGQTVFHAHLHVMPVTLHAIEELIEHEHMEEVPGWTQVAELWQKKGPYHYMQFRDHRRLIEGNGEMNWEFRRRVAIAAGMRFEGGRLVRPTTKADVDEVPRRWDAWAGSRLVG